MSTTVAVEEKPTEVVRPMWPVSAIRSIGITAGRRTQPDLNDPAEVLRVYRDAVTMLHCQMVELINASASLDMDNTEFLGLARRWVALLEQTVPTEDDDARG
jgi:hypothetical protein